MVLHVPSFPLMGAPLLFWALFRGLCAYVCMYVCAMTEFSGCLGVSRLFLILFLFLLSCPSLIRVLTVRFVSSPYDTVGSVFILDRQRYIRRFHHDTCVLHIGFRQRLGKFLHLYLYAFNMEDSLKLLQTLDAPEPRTLTFGAELESILRFNHSCFTHSIIVVISNDWGFNYSNKGNETTWYRSTDIRCGGEDERVNRPGLERWDRGSEPSIHIVSDRSSREDYRFDYCGIELRRPRHPCC